MPVYFDGILVALFSFVIIGIFHPIVIQCEYHYSSRIWPLFLAAGVLLLAGALFTDGMRSIGLGLMGASCLWSIRELKEQEQRVAKGWFPKNPKRRQSDERQAKASSPSTRKT